MISDLKEFEKFLKICRKQGVTDVTLSGVSVKLGDLPLKANDSDEQNDAQTGELTEEEIMFSHVRDIGMA